MRKVTALGELLKGSEKQEKKFFEGDQKRNKGGAQGGGRGCLLAPHSYCECIFMRNAD